MSAEKPDELLGVFEKINNEITDAMMNAWIRGVCDGFEHCSRVVEQAIKTYPGVEELPLVANVMRLAQAALLVDGINLTEDKP